MIFVGVDPWRYIKEKNETVRALMTQAVEEALDTMEKRDHNLAVDIAKQVSRLFEG